MTTGLHVVLGTGPAGRAVATALLEQGGRVRMINRSGTPTVPGVETVGGDATDVGFTGSVAAGADTRYFCLNAPHYQRWAEEFPPLQHAVFAAARASGATLVALENLYMYGPSSEPLHETTPLHPTSAKTRTRAAMPAELLDAHRRGGATSAPTERGVSCGRPGGRESSRGWRPPQWSPTRQSRTGRPLSRPTVSP
jgi:nucleoside-diphosphate-sugar epimerase